MEGITWKYEGLRHLYDVIETETQSNIEQDLVSQFPIDFISQLLLRSRKSHMRNVKLHFM